jgi:monoamine oxidase
VSELTRRQLLVGAATAGAVGALAPDAFALDTTPASGRLSADVVIVGAGLAGLSAARTLLKKRPHLDVVVLEARDRVGGRTLNHSIGGGHIVEVGGQWFGPARDIKASDPTAGFVRGQSRIRALSRAMGLRTYPTYNKGKYVDYRSDLPGHHFTYSGRIPTDDPTGTAEAFKALKQLDAMARQVPLDAPWKAPRALEWDAMTMQSFIDHGDTISYGKDPSYGTPGSTDLLGFTGMTTRGGRHLVELAIQAVFSAEPRDLSLLHVLFYIHAAGSIESLVNTGGGAQQDRVHGGSQLVSLHTAHHLGHRVRLSSPVYRIEQKPHGVVVSGEKFSVHAKRVVVAVPPTLAGRIDYAPAMPALRDQLMQRMPMGTVIKVQCVYSSPFWRAEGLAGQATSDTGPVRVTFDNSPPGAHPSVGVMMGFIEGADGRAALSMSRAERREGVIESFVRYFGPKARKVEAYVEKSWAAEPWTRGCYAGYFTPGGWTDYGHVLRKPVGRIHWAGTETATEWNGYMDGAVRSGERVAKELLRHL